MSIDWAINLLNGSFGQQYASTTGLTACNNMVGCLSATLSGVIPVLFPVMIAVAVLFGGYAILKGLYHSRF